MTVDQLESSTHYPFFVPIRKICHKENSWNSIVMYDYVPPETGETVKLNAKSIQDRLFH
jgi:hypothetical protein